MLQNQQQIVNTLIKEMINIGKSELNKLQIQRIRELAKEMQVIETQKKKSTLIEEVLQSLVMKLLTSNQYNYSTSQYNPDCNLLLNGKLALLKKVVLMRNESFKIANYVNRQQQLVTQAKPNQNQNIQQHQPYNLQQQMQNSLIGLENGNANQNQPAQNQQQVVNRECICKGSAKAAKEMKQKAQNSVITCMSCGKLSHTHCMQFTRECSREEKRTFECCDCVLKKMDPLNLVIYVLAHPTIVQKNNAHQFQFILDPQMIEKVCENQQLGLEVRCLRLTGLDFYEPAWPDLGELLLNGKCVKEFKPLQIHSCLKKRKDDAFFTRHQLQPGINSFSFKEINPTLNVRQLYRIDDTQIHVAGVYLIKKLSPNELIEQIKNRDSKRLPYCKQRVINSLNNINNTIRQNSRGINNQQNPKLQISQNELQPQKQQQTQNAEMNEELGIESEHVSLNDVLDMQLIQTPVFGKFCTHLSCFSLENLVQMMLTSAPRRWQCPICKQKCFDFCIDTYMQAILHIVRDKQKEDPTACFPEVIFKRNGDYELRMVRDQDSSDEDVFNRQDQSIGDHQIQKNKLQYDQIEAIKEEIQIKDDTQIQLQQKISNADKRQIAKNIIVIDESDEEVNKQSQSKSQTKMTQAQIQVQKDTIIQQQLQNIASPTNNNIQSGIEQGNQDQHNQTLTSQMQKQAEQVANININNISATEIFSPLEHQMDSSMQQEIEDAPSQEENQHGQQHSTQKSQKSLQFFSCHETPNNQQQIPSQHYEHSQNEQHESYQQINAQHSQQQSSQKNIQDQQIQQIPLQVQISNSDTQMEIEQDEQQDQSEEKILNRNQLVKKMHQQLMNDISQQHQSQSKSNINNNHKSDQEDDGIILLDGDCDDYGCNEQQQINTAFLEQKLVQQTNEKQLSDTSSQKILKNVMIEEQESEQQQLQIQNQQSSNLESSMYNINNNSNNNPIQQLIIAEEQNRSLLKQETLNLIAEIKAQDLKKNLLQQMNLQKIGQIGELNGENNNKVQDQEKIAIQMQTAVDDQIQNQIQSQTQNLQIAAEEAKSRDLKTPLELEQMNELQSLMKVYHDQMNQSGKRMQKSMGKFKQEINFGQYFLRKKLNQQSKILDELKKQREDSIKLQQHKVQQQQSIDQDSTDKNDKNQIDFQSQISSLEQQEQDILSIMARIKGQYTEKQQLQLKSNIKNHPIYYKNTKEYFLQNIKKTFDQISKQTDSVPIVQQFQMKNAPQAVPCQQQSLLQQQSQVMSNWQQKQQMLKFNLEQIQLQQMQALMQEEKIFEEQTLKQQQSQQIQQISPQQNMVLPQYMQQLTEQQLIQQKQNQQQLINNMLLQHQHQQHYPVQQNQQFMLNQLFPMQQNQLHQYLQNMATAASQQNIAQQQQCFVNSMLNQNQMLNPLNPYAQHLQQFFPQLHQQLQQQQNIVLPKNNNDNSIPSNSIALNPYAHLLNLINTSQTKIANNQELNSAQDNGGEQLSISVTANANNATKVVGNNKINAIQLED